MSQDRTGVIVMGDLPEDASVSSSPKNSEVTLTIGFLNEKVNDSCVIYRSKWVGIIPSVATLDCSQRN